MNRNRIAAMSLVFFTILHPALAQVSTPATGSPGNNGGSQQAGVQSGKSRLKDKKGATSSETEPFRHPMDITASGKIFQSACSSIDKPAEQLSSFETHSNVQCLSYVDGIFETMSLIDVLNLQPRTFCEPEYPVQRKTLVQIVMKYLANHSGTSNERTVLLVWLAISEAFPCHQEKS